MKVTEMMKRSGDAMGWKDELFFFSFCGKRNESTKKGTHLFDFHWFTSSRRSLAGAYVQCIDG